VFTEQHALYDHTGNMFFCVFWPLSKQASKSISKAQLYSLVDTARWWHFPNKNAALQRQLKTAVRQVPLYEVCRQIFPAALEAMSPKLVRVRLTRSVRTLCQTPSQRRKNGQTKRRASLCVVSVRGGRTTMLHRNLRGRDKNSGSTKNSRNTVS